MKVNLSRGHSDKCIGAEGLLSEIKEAEKVMEQLAVFLRKEGVTVRTFVDRKSKTQNTNLKTIVSWHNSSPADLEISTHLNAGGGTGVEVWYYTGDLKGKVYAEKTSEAMSSALNLPNRGAKATKELRFLNSTKGTAILLEVCFVDRKEDEKAIHKSDMYSKLGISLAEAITGKKIQVKKGIVGAYARVNNNIREQPNWNSKTKVTVPNFYYVQLDLDSLTNGFVKVKFQDKWVGWHKANMKEYWFEKSPIIEYEATTNFNARLQSKWNSKVVKVIKKGTAVKVVGKAQNGWLKLLFTNGAIGYIPDAPHYVKKV
ncbi:N-acetylmuramoyl-L-alanine amidase [Listeria fleischmannii]|nr:N-acetylmuramoyl-L-alanine amidase [Listeria fleischmannii]EIA20020.1 Ply protein [Listeria fleischmannii subsp. coloradonensis]STY36042.1 N-acetylmuramoyl-L-alanine amidase CwlD [Listeria fleischmannii subsp. coloradonensis]